MDKEGPDDGGAALLKELFKHSLHVLKGAQICAVPDGSGYAMSFLVAELVTDETTGEGRSLERYTEWLFASNEFAANLFTWAQGYMREQGHLSPYPAGRPMGGPVATLH
jgi:hypothetical protein